jgi:DNA mismatch endonuclease (patch repair protein)
VALTRAKIAVFVDGCFWHGCSEHGVTPKHNRDWWISKIEATQRRDLRKDRELEERGWQVIHIWEHEAATDAAERVVHEWLKRTRRS